MTRRLLVSSATHTRLAWAWESLQSIVEGSEAVVLAPTRGAADDFVRQHCPSGCLGIHRFTPMQLASVLAGELMAEAGLAPLSGLGAEALAARASHEVRERLRYFSPVAAAPGFAKALARTISELRLADVPFADLEGSGAPGADLAVLLAHYEESLEAARLADLATVLRLAAEAAEVREHRLSGLPQLFLDALPRTALDRLFVQALVSRSRGVLATALDGDEAIDGFEALLGVQRELLTPQPATSHERVRSYVFAAAVPSPAPLDATVDFFSAAGEGLECVEIARRIRSLAAEGVAFDRIAILLRNPDDYLPLLEDALERASIGVWFARGALRPDPAGRAFLALLECAAEGLSASKFAEYLSLGQTPRIPQPPAWTPPDDELLASLKEAPAENPSVAEPPETDESPVLAGTVQAPAGWENLLIDAAVIGGRDRWERRLRGLEGELRLQLQEAGEEDARRANVARQLARLRNLQEFALPLIGLLDALPQRSTWGDWLPALNALAVRALRQPASVESVLSELPPMSAVGPIGLDEVHAVLAERLRYLRREPAGNRYGRVFAGSVAEASGRSFDYVFLPGLAEGAFPRKSPEDPLLLDEYRGRLPGDLMTRDRRFAEERQLLRIAAGAARERLLVSYPRADAVQGRTRVPSFYALEVLRAAEGYLPELRELEKRASEGSQSRLGWPAPSNAADAIDDAEHDLALLEPLLRAHASETRGRGKYLLQANPHLARSLRARWKKWGGKWSDSDGLVDADTAARDALARHRLRSRSYSASTLQQYAACPYRFLLYGIHGLRVRDEAASLEQLDPLTRGGLFHEVQRDFFRAMQREGRLPITPDSIDEALNTADRVLDAVAARNEDELAPAIPRVWRTEIENIRTDLRAWIKLLPERHIAWTPVNFEYSFGLPLDAGHDPLSANQPAIIFDGIQVRGSIDLVEENAAGMLRVTDHKTGRAPEKEPYAVGRGEILQPMLYSMAAGVLTGKPVHSGLLFYCTQRGNYQQTEIAVNDRSRAHLKAVLDGIDAAIEDGFLPAAPRAEACGICDYRTICGPYEEQRIKRKPQERLIALQELRGLP